MGKRKQKQEEHINLERWMVSYSDFVTLLFATFVVLYALSQVDIQDFKTLEDSIRQAFSAPSVMQGKDGIMESSSNTLFDSQPSDSLITPLMMEYVSQKYEEQSMQEIEKSVNEMVKSGNLDGVEVFKTDKGVIIRFNDAYLFKSGSAELVQGAKAKLDIVGAIIAKKFVLHNMRIEGHTDSHAMKSAQFPSNWELSSARSGAIIRYLISRFSFVPSIFTSVGFADTRPIESNSNLLGQSKNRRVEIIILKRKFNSIEDPQYEVLKMSKKEQEEMQNKRILTINRIESITNATKKSRTINKTTIDDTIILNQVYEKEIKRLSKETNAFDTETKKKVTGQGSWLRPPAVTKVKVFKQ